MNKYILLILTLCCTSCGEDFFNQVPSNQVVSTNYYKNETDFDMAVTACYQRLKSEVSFFLTEVEYRGDSNNLDAVAVSTQSRYDLDHFQDISTNTILADLWSNEYNCIYRCNSVLDNRPVANSGAGRNTRSEGCSISKGFGAFCATTREPASKRSNRRKIVENFCFIVSMYFD